MLKIQVVCLNVTVSANSSINFAVHNIGLTSKTSVPLESTYFGLETIFGYLDWIRKFDLSCTL
jgi:hypothetical protein